MARHTIDVLDATEGPIVLPSGSCGDMIVHHIPELLAAEVEYAERSKAVSERTRELTQFLVDDLNSPARVRSDELVAYHPSCHGLRNLDLGTQPDVLLGDIPPFSLQDESYIYIAVVVSLIVFANRNQFKTFEKPLLYFDAIGLGTFVVIGTTKALDFQLGLLGAVLMGTMTGTAGGVIRDLLANQVPLILRREIYASACVAGSIILVILEQIGTARPIAALLAAGTVIVVRLLAIRYDWGLPKS